MQSLNTKAKNILIKARELLIKRGWCKNNYINNKGAHCSIGAINASYPEMDYEARTKAINLLRIVVKTSHITGWNDGAKRTKRQVLAAFNKAIKLADRTK